MDEKSIATKGSLVAASTPINVSAEKLGTTINETHDLLELLEHKLVPVRNGYPEPSQEGDEDVPSRSQHRAFLDACTERAEAANRRLRKLIDEIEL